MSRTALLAAALACGLVVAGCAGPPDLSKKVANRTTVKATSTFSDDMLRTVEPCKLYSDEVIASIGKKGSDSPDRRGYSECALAIKSADGKTDIRMVIKVGSDMFAAPKEFGKRINGLGVFETRTSTGCTENALTGTDPERGIVAQAFYEGSDPCVSATKLLEGAVRLIADNPPKYQETRGSLVTLDPCAAVDDPVARSVLGDAPTKVQYGIRTCLYEGKSVSFNVRYNIDFEPFAAHSSQKPARVDVSGTVKGAAQWKDSVAPNKCQIEWVHRALAGNRGENVNVSFERSPPDPNEDACAKALAAARSVAGKLPAA